MFEEQVSILFEKKNAVAKEISQIKDNYGPDVFDTISLGDMMSLSYVYHDVGDLDIIFDINFKNRFYIRDRSNDLHDIKMLFKVMYYRQHMCGNRGIYNTFKSYIAL